MGRILSVKKPRSPVRRIVCAKCGLGSEAGTIIKRGKEYIHAECPADYMKFRYYLKNTGVINEPNEPDEPTEIHEEGDEDS